MKYTEPTYPHLLPKYGQTTQLVKPEDTATHLNKKETRFVQEVIETFLFYTQAVDSTMLKALSAIAAEQANPMTTILKKTMQFLDYAAKHDKAIVMNHASNMILVVHSDTLYLSEPQACSRAGGYFFMSTDVMIPPNNGTVHNTAQILKM